MTDNRVLNFLNFKCAFDHFNVVYNLKTLLKNRSIAPQANKAVQKDISDKAIQKDISNIEISKNELKMLLLSLNRQTNVIVNKTTVSKYFKSSKWKKNNYNSTEIKKIIEYLETLKNINMKYILHIEKIILYKSYTDLGI